MLIVTAGQSLPFQDRLWCCCLLDTTTATNGICCRMFMDFSQVMIIPIKKECKEIWIVGITFWHTCTLFHSALIAKTTTDTLPHSIGLSPVSHPLCSLTYKGKGKAVPLQPWSGPEGSRKLRFPDFMTTAQDGGKVVSLTHRPPLPPGNTPGTLFC